MVEGSRGNGVRRGLRRWTRESGRIYYACIDDTWLDILMHSRDSILGRPTKAFDAATKALLIPLSRIR